MHFTVYSKPKCVYCDRAKTLITAKGYTYDELIIDIGQQKDADKVYVTVQQLKTKLPSAQTVPQIFMGEKHLGGFDALKKFLDS